MAFNPLISPEMMGMFPQRAEEDIVSGITAPTLGGPQEALASSLGVGAGGAGQAVAPIAGPVQSLAAAPAAGQAAADTTAKTAASSSPGFFATEAGGAIGAAGITALGGLIGALAQADQAARERKAAAIREAGQIQQRGFSETGAQLSGGTQSALRNILAGIV